MKLTSSAEAMRRLRLKRKESGVCPRCGRTSSMTSGFCLSCRQQMKSYKKPKIKTAFRRLRRWTVTNHSLYNYLVEEKISAKEFAQMFGVSERTVLRWVFEKGVPKEPLRSRIEARIHREVF